MTGGFGPTPLPIELAHQLVALNDRAVEVVWVTSWHEMANTLLDACGIATRLRCHPTVNDDTVNDKWQFVVTELPRDPAPFVWIDDQQITPSTWRWAATCGVANLLVHTNRYHGLTPSTWSAVIDWLQGKTGGDLSHIGGPAGTRQGARATMHSWFAEIATESWEPAADRSLPYQPESPALSSFDRGCASFHPQRRSDDPPEGNVWTLRNGELLDTPERFFDWLGRYYRDHVEPTEPGSLDRLEQSRCIIEQRANQRLRRSHN